MEKPFQIELAIEWIKADARYRLGTSFLFLEDTKWHTLGLDATSFAMNTVALKQFQFGPLASDEAKFKIDTRAE